MEALSSRINSLPVSATLAMAAKARELKNNGIDVIGLSLGEPDFKTPEFIKDAAIQAVNDNWNSYSPVDGYADLNEAICIFLVVTAFFIHGRLQWVIQSIG